MKWDATFVKTLVDLTLLYKEASESDLLMLAKTAAQTQVAAICVLPEHLPWLPAVEGIKRATVMNFPEGIQKSNLVLQQLFQAMDDKIDEVDYVFPYQDYLQGNEKQAFMHYQEIARACKVKKLTLKVILETGAFPSMDSIYQLSRKLIDQGCDFLKTSTGKIHTGATLPAAFAMLSALKDSANTECGIKISGGIKTFAAALPYLQLASIMMDKPLHKQWFRMGVSRLWSEV